MAFQAAVERAYFTPTPPSIPQNCGTDRIFVCMWVRRESELHVHTNAWNICRVRIIYGSEIYVCRVAQVHSNVKWVSILIGKGKWSLIGYVDEHAEIVYVVLQLSLKLSAKELSLMETSTARLSWNETLCKLLCPLKCNWIIVSDKWCEISAVIYGHSKYIN